MPTALSHPAVPLAAHIALGRARVSWRLLGAGVIASILPDADVVAFRLGIPYANAYGHRGASHSVAFALVVALLAAAAHAQLRATRRMSFLFVLAAAVSHPLLDAITDGGLGVALLWPVSDARFFAPIRPIHVAPLSARRLLSGRGWHVLWSEVTWVWAPAAAACASAWMSRRRGRFGPAIDASFGRPK